MACGGALVWAGRQQGPRRLLAVWRALGDAHPLSGGEGRQQGRGQAAGWAPSPAAAAWSQQQLGGYCSLAALQPGAGAAPACAAQLASSAAGAARLARGPLHAWLQQRGMALNFARYQKRRGQGMPDRNLPQRNEEIKAQEVRLCTWRVGEC